MKIVSNSAKETKDIAQKLAKFLLPGNVIALVGNLGSGKTTFVKGLAAGLGCRESDVLSPTFVLMHQYQGRLTLNHFDLYRLKDIRQLEDTGYEEYFYGSGITVIEWADKIKESLPKEYLEVKFLTQGGYKRLLKFTDRGKIYAYNFWKTKRKAAKVS